MVIKTRANTNRLLPFFELFHKDDGEWNVTVSHAVVRVKVESVGQRLKLREGPREAEIDDRVGMGFDDAKFLYADLELSSHSCRAHFDERYLGCMCVEGGLKVPQ